MNGKGDKWRAGTNFSAYYDNFDEIFKKSKNKTESAGITESNTSSVSGACITESLDVLSGENPSGN